MRQLLIIDDDQVFCEIIAMTLSSQNVTVTIANSAFDGLNAASNIDHILLDLKIASDSGLKLIPELLKINSAAKIVILTGYANIQTAIEAIKLGAVYYLSKPAKISEILLAFDKTDGDTATGIETETLTLNRLERQHIETVLAKNNGNISQAARELKMHRRTLQRKLAKTC